MLGAVAYRPYLQRRPATVAGSITGSLSTAGEVSDTSEICVFCHAA
jgi:hypothetical protein